MDRSVDPLLSRRINAEDDQRSGQRLEFHFQCDTQLSTRGAKQLSRVGGT
jgi:hypothetical protein